MRLPGLAVLLCALTLGGAARAEVWAWVDERGVPHFASHQVDARYQLFFKGSAPELLVKPMATPASTLSSSAQPATALGTLVPVSPSGPSAGALTAAAASPRPRLLGLLENSPGYKRVLPLVQDVARQLGLDAQLMVALIAAESGFDPRAVSPKGAVGLMQLMPGTAERYGVRADSSTSQRERLMQPETNVRAGALFLRDLLLMFPGRIDLVLAAYNAGPGAVMRAGLRIPNYPETQNYVRTVTELFAYLRPAAPAPKVEVAALPPPAQAPAAPAPAATWLSPQAADAVSRGILLAPPGIPLSLPASRD
jgi:soluble lytic murein transglycosylase-like protein